MTHCICLHSKYWGPPKQSIHKKATYSWYKHSFVQILPHTGHSLQAVHEKDQRTTTKGDNLHTQKPMNDMIILNAKAVVINDQFESRNNSLKHPVVKHHWGQDCASNISPVIFLPRWLSGEVMGYYMVMYFIIACFIALECKNLRVPAPKTPVFFFWLVLVCSILTHSAL